LAAAHGEGSETATRAARASFREDGDAKRPGAIVRTGVETFRVERRGDARGARAILL
jgi:hypothetical protein